MFCEVGVAMVDNGSRACVHVLQCATQLTPESVLRVVVCRKDVCTGEEFGQIAIRDLSLDLCLE